MNKNQEDNGETIQKHKAPVESSSQSTMQNQKENIAKPTNQNIAEQQSDTEEKDTSGTHKTPNRENQTQNMDNTGGSIHSPPPTPLIHNGSHEQKTQQNKPTKKQTQKAKTTQ